MGAQLLAKRDRSRSARLPCWLSGLGREVSGGTTAAGRAGPVGCGWFVHQGT